MLGNNVFLERVAEDGALARAAAGMASGTREIPAAHVIRNDETATMSDHYPSRVEWNTAPSWLGV